MTIPWKKDNNGLCGLINMGNTCYMNSVFQILLHHDRLVNYFISKRFEKDINEEKKESMLVKEFSRLANGYWSFDKFHQIKPLSIMKVLWEMNSMFHPQIQNDAQEFLMFLLDNVHTGLEHSVRIKLNQNAKKTPLLSKAMKHWKDFFGENYSELINLYYFQIRTTMQCSNNHQSISFNPYSILSIDITADSLNECLRNHFQKENVEYTCQTCQSSCTKQETIQYLSEYLFIQLKRFHFTPNGTQKISNQVNYTTDLSLDNYTDLSGDKCHYELDGMILHQGSSNSGHYFCYQKHKNIWYKFDDNMIIKKEQGVLNDKDVYVLIYKKTV